MTEMRNIKLVIEYDGTNYHGWQIQPGLKTIQGVIEANLSMITKTETSIIGAGRTDAGVHALGQVANFRTESRMTPDEFKSALNSVLPKDIAIINVQEVGDDFHARYSATSRTYEYMILNDSTPSVFLRNYTYPIRQSLNVGLMAKACKSLVGTQDFSSFASTGDPVHSFVRTVSEANCWESQSYDNGSFAFYPQLKPDAHLICFRICANTFLRGMVRAIVGTLVEIGKGKIPLDKMKEIIEAKDRSVAGPSLPARGLCLTKVNYASNT